MFSGAELERLRLQKQLLQLRADASRLALVADGRRISSPELWLSGAGQVVRRHPFVTTAVAVAAGILAIKALRRPGAVTSLVELLGAASPALLAAWRLFDRK